MEISYESIQLFLNVVACIHIIFYSHLYLSHFLQHFFPIKAKNLRDRKNLRDFQFEEVLQDKTNGEYVVLKGNIQGKAALVKLSAKPLPATSLVGFVPCLSLQLHSESGAEYAYYQAELSRMNFCPFLQMTPPQTYHIELICPASKRQIERSRAVAVALIEETPEMYKKVTEPFIQQLIGDGKSIQWVYNILEKKKEVERIVYDSGGTGPQDFIVSVDTKWKSHPDPSIVPKNEWKNKINTQDVYCLGIVQLRGIHSLRALTAEHVPLLQAMMEDGLRAIEETYNVSRTEMRVFIHYQPQFYHLHVHYAHISNELGVTVERAHLLSDIIQNLMISSEYYLRKTITYRLQVSDKLYKQHHGVLD